MIVFYWIHFFYPAIKCRTVPFNSMIRRYYLNFYLILYQCSARVHLLRNQSFCMRPQREVWFDSFSETPFPVFTNEICCVSAPMCRIPLTYWTFHLVIPRYINLCIVSFKLCSKYNQQISFEYLPYLKIDS